VQSHNVGMVQLRHDGRLPLQVLPDVAILDLAESHHLQGDLLLQDDVVGQDHLAEGSFAEGCRGDLIVPDGAGEDAFNTRYSTTVQSPESLLHRVHLRSPPLLCSL
jgi:hypothetical protein